MSASGWARIVDPYLSISAGISSGPVARPLRRRLKALARSAAVTGLAKCRLSASTVTDRVLGRRIGLESVV